MPGVGWVPLESTPGGASPVVYGQGSGAVAANAQLEPTPVPEQATPEPLESESAIEDDMQVDQRQQNTDGTTEEEEPGLFQTYWLIAVLLGVSLVILLLWLTNFLWRRIWKHRFTGPDPNRAALYLYAYMERLCRYGCDIPPESKQIAMKAQFSPHKIEEDELERMRDDLETCKKDIQKSQPQWKARLLKLWGFI